MFVYYIKIVYITKKEIFLIVGSQTLQLESSHLFSDKIFSFSFFHIDSIHRKQTLFIPLILKAYTFDTIEIFSAILANSKKTPNICDKIALY